MRYVFLVIFLFCLFILGAQFQSAMRIWTSESRSGAYLIGLLAPALVPTLIFGIITIWFFKRNKKQH